VKHRWLLASLAVVLFVAATPQQNPPLPPLGETLEVSIVNVDVYVTDKTGNRVRGLTKDDFEIYDGTVRQPISNFSEYSAAGPEGEVDATLPGAAAQSPTPTQKRTVVVFIERMKLRAHQAQPFIDSIKKTLSTIIRPDDDAAVVLWSRGATARIEFTDDLARIGTALDTIARDADGVAFDEDRMLRELDQDTKEFDEAAAACAAEKGLGFGGTASGLTNGTLVLMQLQRYEELKLRVAAIDAAISSMSGADGKKILLLAPRDLSEGPPKGNRIEVEYFDKWRLGSDRLMKPVLENANANAVTIYTLYAPGLGMSMPDAAMKPEQVPDPASDHVLLLNQMFPLKAIAETTGGLMASNVTDIVKLLPRVEEDVTDYYSLAFRGGKDADHIRDVVVKAKNPDYVVRSRRQYVEKSDVARMKDRVTAALTLMPRDRFDITATVGTIAQSGKRGTVPLAIRIPISALTVLPTGGSYAGAFSVFVAAGSPRGTSTEIVQKTQPFELTDVKAAADGYFTYRVDVALDQEMDRVAVGVLDDVSKDYALLRVPVR
jgi:VWFA-related protein